MRDEVPAGGQTLQIENVAGVGQSAAFFGLPFEKRAEDGVGYVHLLALHRIQNKADRNRCRVVFGDHTGKVFRLFHFSVFDHSVSGDLKIAITALHHFPVAETNFPQRLFRTSGGKIAGQTLDDVEAGRRHRFPAGAALAHGRIERTVQMEQRLLTYPHAEQTSRRMNRCPGTRTVPAIASRSAMRISVIEHGRGSMPHTA